MAKKNLAGALIASVSLPLMLATFSVPLANAASVSSTVVTVDNCKWVMANVPGSIDMTSEAIFNGDALVVSAVIEAPTLGLSGTTTTVAAQGASTECSFYNSVIDASVSAGIDATSFVANYGASNTPDTTMDFDIGPTAPLDLVFSVESCNVDPITGWAANPVEFTSIATTEMFSFTSLDDEYVAGAAPICHPEVTVDLTIPQRTSVPEGAGQQYNWDGPTITFSSSPNNYND